ncbi:MAG: class D beta-lactamase [Chitinophagaceae bacterium]|nr:class D beta-lactamase [Chitinophagaceae bacterium]MBL0054834.1 class D beta-lactamase [Chitinophagaceae bacterium]
MNSSKAILALVSLAALLNACSVNKAKTDNSLKKYFDENGVDGCFTYLDNASGEITVYNMNLDTQRFSPASTFKIVNSLIGLQTGRITNDTMTIKWDGVKRRVDDWNKDMGMTEAFKASSVPYYQEVARRIGRDTMKFWIDSLGYGNKDIGGAIDSFWLNNHLKISPDEQLGLVKRLYFDQLPFRKSVHQMVKNAMLQENNTAYQLSYKTGWGFEENGHAIGWVVGWIEENRHVYFFVTFVKAPDEKTDIRTVRMNITKGILKHLGFMEGKK